MSQLKDIKENVLKAFKAEENQLKFDIKDKFDVFNIAIRQRIKMKYLKSYLIDLSTKNKNLEEQIELKESEKIEYEEGDLKSAKEYVDQIKGDHKKIEREFNKKQANLFEMITQTESVINQLLKYKKKFAEIPAIMEAERVKSETTLENQSLKLNTIKQDIKECHSQEEVTLTKIAETDTKISNIVTSSTEKISLINEEKTLAANIIEYQDQRIPGIINEIEKIKMNIFGLEQLIEEKNQIKSHVLKTFDDLNAKIHDEKVKDKNLREEMQSIKKLRSDIINNIISVKDIDGNPNLKRLTLSKEYKKQMDKIRKLTDDNKLICKDAEASKLNLIESGKALELIKEEIKKKEENLLIKEDEVMTLDKDIKNMEAELEALDKEIEVISKESDALETKKKSMMSALDALSDKCKKLESNSANCKTLTNNSKMQVHKWLNSLPNYFNNNVRTSSRDSLDSISLSIPDIDLADYQDNDLFNSDIPDPEAYDDDMDCSFSDVMSSEYNSPVLTKK